jgi:tetratricopeptide (TPR) repeat protein
MRASMKRVCLGCAVAMVVGLPALAERPAGEEAAPTVTRKEAELLASVTAIAATNAPAALLRLQPSLDEDASAALDFTAGNICLQSGEHAAALVHYREALTKAPGFRTARLNGARAGLLAEEYASTLGFLLPLVEEGGAGTDVMLLLGHAYALRSRPVSAESAYRQALLLDADNLDAMVGLAKALLLQERYAEGSAMAQECLLRDAVRAEAWSLASEAARAAGQDRAAVTRLETARRLKVATPAMLATLGDLHAMQARPREAVAVYREAFAVADPSSTRMLRAAQALLALEQAAEAGEYLKRLEAVIPPLARHDQVLLYRLQAMAYQQVGEPAAAIAALKQALVIDPLAAEILIRLGDLLRAAGESRAAETHYLRAAQDADWRGRALLRQAVMAAEAGRYRVAVTLLEEARQADTALSVGRYLTAVRSLADRAE